MAARSFRTQESYVAERTTRDMVPEFLSSRGFDVKRDERKAFGPTESQRIVARDERGRSVVMKVRLCWRRGRGRARARAYSAAQLTARLKDGDWIRTLEDKLRPDERNGTTHLLLIQRDGNQIIYAAAVPIGAVIPVWIAQRDISARLIKQGKVVRKKNHAMNGVSPTIWLEDEHAPQVAAALWTYRGVRDLAKLPMVETESLSEDDSMDDLTGVDLNAVGTDSPTRVLRIRSGVKRDPKVRATVLTRAKGVCERVKCGETRKYPGFLDVHHILGAEKSDRVWNCVALCPNCHREAHYAPDRDSINADLLSLAGRLSPRAGE